jgi:MoxR-like ATPase
MSVQDFRIAFGHYDNSPEYYHLPPDSPLQAALRLALKLGKPLLITGEPGTGKTQLAHWAAWFLSQQTGGAFLPFVSKPFVFSTKTQSTGRDLFYQYDAIAHFQDKEGRRKVSEFISLHAMGQAIVQTMGREAIIANENLAGIRNLSSIDPAARSSVVLIDEIDKAPRDFTNDLLHELENNRFQVPELGCELERSADRRARMLVVMTSNSEKNLPDAFLRRCLFFHVPFPSEDELLQILISRLGPFLSELEASSTENFEDHYRRVLQVFKFIRESSVVKPPSTSELLDWVKVLHLERLIDRNFDERNIRFMPPEQKQAIQLSLYTLLKTREDLEAIESLLALKPGT